ncbi:MULTISPECIES: hypothetical protein [unclassified Aureispira]|uniref:hypothetical protein n=1 Tax=unclassified Aureispira TaxID=2649989 RepID=UPI0006964E16|nr:MULTISPECIES: hypothetical protein [unclassified Aureispira]WMX12707.1 hypothetical protein QP953_17890 [Aureispira sp. CCB-E]
MPSKSSLSTFLICLLVCITTQAQEGLNIESVSIFKNKTAFFVKKGTVATQNNSWLILGDTIPAALNGTFWLNSPDNDFKLVKAYKKTIKTKEQAVASDFAAMLALNDGKTATLYFKDTLYTGKILFMQVTPKKKPDAPNLKAPLFALITKEGKTMVFKESSINGLMHIEFSNTPQFTYDYTQSKQLPALQIDFKSDKPKQALDMMYLCNGLAWKPDYKIELIEENKAKLSLRSTVLNEAEDISTKKLNLVAGVPNFKYATSISELINFLDIHIGGFANNVQAFGNIAIPQNQFNETVYNSPTTFSGNTTTASPAPSFGEATAMEDLYFYTLNDVVLKKGERAFFDIFTVDVPVEHIYEAVLSDNNITYALEYSFIKKENPVVHTIKLTNNSKFTWTAGSALVLKNDKNQQAPISQDKLGYTSQKDDISVKLTEAPDVSVRFLEKETNRTPNKKSLKKGNYTYYNDLVEVEAEVTVHNYKNKAIRLDLKRAIAGELDKSNLEWQLAPRVQFGYTLNKKTDVCWELKLKAGEEKVIRYTYSFYTSEHR